MAAQRRSKDGLDATVVVVGAGLSGLIAARELRRLGVEDVIVLEAAGRAGGRVLSETTALGSRVDLGGQWIGTDHHRLVALARELGVTTFPMHTRFMPLLVDGPRRVSPFAPQTLLAVLVLAGVDVITRLGAPARWSDATVAAGLCKVPGPTARRLLELVAAVSWTADLDRFSVGAMTRMIRSQGGLLRMLSTRGGAQDSLMVQGAGALTDSLAADLGDRLRTDREVTAIVRDPGAVTVQTASGNVRTRKAIITVPPPIAARIAHQPPLPPSRVSLEQHTYMGSVYKAVAVYERPFWRDRAGGEYLVLSNGGFAVFDTSPPDGPGHLCMLVGGPAARALDDVPSTTRRDRLLGQLTSHIGPGVLEPTGWHEKSWHLDQHAGGGYTALPTPDAPAEPLPMPSTPTGDLHWAGTETAADHPGYLDGAIEAGRRAAREAFHALPRPDDAPPSD